MIAVSVDFASAEHLSHSFQLMRELRALPENQDVVEDKLQVKNLIYHSVKNALAVIEKEEKNKVKNNVDTKEEKKEDSEKLK